MSRAPQNTAGKMRYTDTSADAEHVQIKLLRRASPARRAALALSLSRTAIGLSRRAVRRAHPELDERAALLIWAALTYGQDIAQRLQAAGQGGRMEGVEALQMLAPVVETFERLSIPYRIGGSLASSAFGIARTTADVDLVADIQPEKVEALVQTLGSAYYIDEQMIRDAIRDRSSFNLIHLATMLKVDVFLPLARPYEAEAARRVRQETLEDVPGARMFVISAPEDVILAKLEWYRQGGETSERQWLDVQGVLKVQAVSLDVAYLRQWAAALSVSDLLERAREEAGLIHP